MTYIPNVREKMIEPLYKNTRGAKNEPYENAYWEGNLNEREKKMLFAYDWAVNEMKSLFNNLEIYQDFFDELFEYNDIDLFKLSQVLADYYVKEEDEENNEAIQEASDIVKIAYFFQAVLEDYIERSRNQFVVAMIDSQSDEEEVEGNENDNTK